APHPGPLAGWRVLVPRGGPWGRRVARMLSERGAEPVVVPLIEFAPPQDVAALDGALVRAAGGGHTWVVVTSATTVGAVTGRLPHLHAQGLTSGDRWGEVLGGVRVAAVGPGTTRALTETGARVDLEPSGERSARGLVAEFPRPPRGPGPWRVLHPRSDLADATLRTGLTALGWEVDDVVAYRTVPGPPPPPQVGSDLTGGRVDAVLLTSASTVTHLVQRVGVPAAGTVVCCIGPRTREAAVDAGLGVDVVPGAASAEELLDALTAHALDNPRHRAGAGTPMGER
ncbi:uroporphyrin-III methyltransferase, partial [Cellulomonas bogoriensis 69B4 = DSM 16987]